MKHICKLSLTIIGIIVVCILMSSCRSCVLFWDSDKEMNLIDITVMRQGGKIDEESGRLVVATSSRDDFICYSHTPRFIQAYGVSSVQVEEKESVLVFCYDKEYSFIESTDDIDKLPKNTYWIKIQTFQAEGYLESQILKCSVVSQYSILTESFNQAYDKSALCHFSFEVNPKLAVKRDTAFLKRHYDNGFIYLPPNYDPSGPPVPLVIFWHGTGGYNFRNNKSISYKPYLRFITMNGYAVADCSGMTDRYQIGDEAVPGYDCRMTPIALDCFASLYTFLSDNYNLSKDGVHVFGKSNGGLGTVMLGYTQPFPIKSLASLAGSLSIVASFRYSTAVNLNFWLAQFGIDTKYNYQSYWYYNQTDIDIDFIAQNSHLFSEYDPMIKGTNIEPSSFNRLIMDNKYVNHSMNNPELLAIVERTSKHLPKPMKIWHAVDDVSVPIETSVYFKRMVDNGGGRCYLQIIQAGYGGHHSVDNSEHAPHTEYKTPYGGIMTVPLVYAELVEWFNQWQ